MSRNGSSPSEGKKLPALHHVVRYCAPSKLTASKDRPTAAAFMLRPGSTEKPRETFLSVYWLERLAGTDLESRLETLRAFPTTSIHKEMRFSATGLFAVFETGTTEEKVRERCALTLEIAHAPRDGDQFDPHAGIWGYEDDSSDLVAALLSELAEHCLKRVAG